MKKIKYIFILGIAGLTLLASCNNIFDSPQIENNRYGRVKVIITDGNNARSTLPADPTEDLFTDIVYTFTRTTEAAQQTVKHKSDLINGTIEIEPYQYKLKVEAYIGASNTDPFKVAESEITEPFTVNSSGQPTPVTIKLKAVYAGQGTFTYAITYPKGATLTMSLTKWADGSNVDLQRTNSSDSETTVTDSPPLTGISLAASSYVLKITVQSNKSKNYIGFVEAIHIFPSLPTRYTRTITESELIKKAHTYNVYFYKNEDPNNDPTPISNTPIIVDYPKEETIGLARFPANPTHTNQTNYSFVGWYTARTGGTAFTATTDVSTVTSTDNGDDTSDIKVYAHWEHEDLTKYKFIFRKNDTAASAPDPEFVQVTPGDPITFPTTLPELTGRHIVNWNTDTNGSALGTVYTAGSTAPAHPGTPSDPIPDPPRTIEVYAQWDVNTWTVIFDLQGGTLDGSTNNKTETITYSGPSSTTVPLPTNDPTKTGSTFTGWYNAATGGTEYTANVPIPIATDTDDTTNPTKPTIVYAQWKADITYTVSANGTANAETTTQLTLVFDENLSSLNPAFNADDITFTPGTTSAAKGALTGNGTTYYLAISGVAAAGDVKIKITKPGIETEEKTVAIHYAIPVTFSGVSANGDASNTTTQLTLTFSAAITGLSKDDITLTTSDVTGTIAKDTLSGSNPYTLPISGFTSGGSLSVAVSKSGYNISGSPQTVAINYYDPGAGGGDTPVTFSGVTSNHTTSAPTTELTLTFDAEITGLTATDITLTDVTGVLKGALTDNNDNTYTLGISGFKEGGTLSVTIGTISGYTITPATKTVDIYSAFDLADGITDLGTGGSGSQISVNTTTGIISRPTNDDYGNCFSVDLPASIMPIGANDTIIISYIGISSGNDTRIPLTTKTASNGTGDLSPADYDNWTGDLTVKTKSLTALSYGDNIPVSALYFQGRPNDGSGDPASPTNAWKLKIISITKTTGPLIKISNAVPGLKPVFGGTPETVINNRQYTGTVTWNPNDTTFGNSAYTATITLTKKLGYTFEEIAANELAVTGTDDVTHAVGSDPGPLVITAVFPIAKAPASPLSIDFTDSNVGLSAGNANTEITSSETTTTSFTYEMKAGYGPFAYFKVTFDSGYTLSDYTKIDVTFEGLAGDTRYKRINLAVSSAEGSPPASVSGNGYTFQTAECGESTPANDNGTTLPKNDTITDFSKVTSDINLNEVYIAVYVWGNSATWKISNIKFHNDS